MMFFSFLNNFLKTGEVFINNVASSITNIMNEGHFCINIYSIDVLKDLVHFVAYSGEYVCLRSNYDEIDFKSNDHKQPRNIVKKQFDNFNHEFYAFDRYLGKIFSDVLPKLLLGIKDQNDILRNIRTKFIEFAGYGYEKFEEANEFIKSVEERRFFKHYIEDLTKKIKESNENLDKHFNVLFCGYTKTNEKKLQVGQMEEIISKKTQMLISLEKEYEAVRSNIKGLPEKYECYYTGEITAIKKLLEEYNESN